ISRKKLHGTIRAPVQYKDIKKLKGASLIGLILGGIGALAGIISLLLHFFSKTPPP
ncbi:unnamed protein product, partial [marine sediment metagenome]